MVQSKGIPAEWNPGMEESIRIRKAGWNVRAFQQGGIHARWNLRPFQQGRIQGAVEPRHGGI